MLRGCNLDLLFQLLSHVWLHYLLEFAQIHSIESMMPSNHLILCCPFCLPPSIFPGIRVFFNESALCIWWPKYWSFSFSINPSDEYSGLISFRTDWFDQNTTQPITPPADNFLPPGSRYSSVKSHWPFSRISSQWQTFSPKPPFCHWGPGALVFTVLISSEVWSGCWWMLTHHGSWRWQRWWLLNLGWALSLGQFLSPESPGRSGRKHYMLLFPCWCPRDWQEVESQEGALGAVDKQGCDRWACSDIPEEMSRRQSVWVWRVHVCPRNQSNQNLLTLGETLIRVMFC